MRPECPCNKKGNDLLKGCRAVFVFWLFARPQAKPKFTDSASWRRFAVFPDRASWNHGPSQKPFFVWSWALMRFTLSASITRLAMWELPSAVWHLDPLFCRSTGFLWEKCNAGRSCRVPEMMLPKGKGLEIPYVPISMGLVYIVLQSSSCCIRFGLSLSLPWSTRGRLNLVLPCMGVRKNAAASCAPASDRNGLWW